MRSVGYVETNFLVAVLVPHDRSHRQALELLERAEAGDVELRVPRVALMEASPRIARKFNDELLKQLQALRDAIARAAEVVDFLRIDDPLAAALKRYSIEHGDSARVEHELGRIESLCKQVLEPTALAGANAIHPEARGGADIAIFSAILENRTLDVFAAQPAILFSSDEAAFDPKRRKAPALLEHIYDRHKLAFDPSFDLDGAVVRWSRRYGAAAE